MNEMNRSPDTGLPDVLNSDSVLMWLHRHPLESALPTSLPDRMLVTLSESFEDQQPAPDPNINPLDVPFRWPEDGGLPLVMVLYILRNRFQLETLRGTGLNARMVLPLLGDFQQAVDGEIQARLVGQSDELGQKRFLAAIDSTPLNIDDAPGEP